MPKGEKLHLHRFDATGNEWPSTKHASISPTMRDLAWAAGFIEGEGSFSNNGTVAAVQRSPEPLEMLLALFGGSLRLERKHRGGFAPTTRMWIWRTNGARGRGVAMTLYPFLTTR